LSCGEIVELIQDKLPALFFVFSRGRTETLAMDLSREWDFLTPEEKTRAGEVIRTAEIEYPGTFSGPGWQVLQRLLYQGIAYHHAGMLPPVKYLVENLYSQRLVWVVFCTETFAAGVNFPAASAVFDSTRKWDGHDFRILHNREFYQMAGRAGRRGFDEAGHAIIRIDNRFPEQTGFFHESRIEPVYGRLTLSPNTVLSLLRYKSDDEIKRFLQDNFKAYQMRRKEKDLAEKIASLESLIAKETEHLCQDCLTMRCPVERGKAHEKLKRGSRRRKSKTKQQLKRELAQHTSKSCAHPEKCKPSIRKVKKATDSRSVLMQEYKGLTAMIGSSFVEFDEVRDTLEMLGYIDGRDFYPRGLFALELHVQEILVTELAFSGIIEESDPAEVAAVLAGVEYIPGKAARNNVLDLPALREASQIRWELISQGVAEKFCLWSDTPSLLAYEWYNGADFNYLLEMSSMQPGDVFSIFRREIDLLRQIQRAAGDNMALAEKVKAIRARMDREEIALSF